jgi:hypothetical protein
MRSTSQPVGCYRVKVRVIPAVVINEKYESSGWLLHIDGTSQPEGCYKENVRVRGKVVT